MEKTTDSHNNQSQSRATAEPVAQRREESSEALAFEDNRPEAAAQRRIAGMMQNSPQHAATSRMAAMMNGEPVQRTENKTGLPDNLKSGMETLSGMSMDHVKVHYNSSKPAQLNAHAFAQGSEIHLASGQEKHMPHELGHVVQQAQGRVRPTMQMAGVDINDDVGLEGEADIMGAKALISTQLKSIHVYQHPSGKSIQRQEVLQRIVVMDDTQIDLGTIVDVYQILVNGIDNRVTMMSILSKANIDGEQLGLMGHGSKDSFAGKSGAVLAKFLSESGVSSSNRVIDVLACDTGGGVFIDEFVASLTQHGISATVYANEGSGVTLGDGYTHSATPGTKVEEEEYRKILSSFDSEIKKGEEIASTAEAEVKKVVALVNSEAISSMAAEASLASIFLRAGKSILGVTGTLFTQLYEYQTKIVSADKSRNKGVVVKNS